MSEEQKCDVVMPSKDESSVITRRQLLLCAAVGGLATLTGLKIAYRRSKPRPFGLTEITIEGPFEKYGYFRPEDIGREDIKKIKSDFVLNTLIFDEGKFYDSVMISFTFAGKEDPRRKMKVSLIVYDKNGKGIGVAEDIFDDPRVPTPNDEEKVWGGRKLIRIPFVTLNADLPRGIRLLDVGRVEIFAFVMQNA